MLKAMTTYKASLENAKDSFEAIVATGILIMNIVELGIGYTTIYEDAKRFSHGNAVDFVIYLLTNTDSDTYKTIDSFISSCTHIYFMDFEDVLNAVLTLDVDTVNEALRSPDGIQAHNLKIYASLMEYMNN